MRQPDIEPFDVLTRDMSSGLRGRTGAKNYRRQYKRQRYLVRVPLCRALRATPGVEHLEVRREALSP
jgi:hypothetical protein